MADTHQLMRSAPLHLVVNRFEDGLFARREIEQEMHEVVRPVSITFTPHDSKIALSAWEGARAPKGAYRKALAQVVNHLMTTPIRQSNSA